jgi:DNA polymerase-3 subunit epsilon
MSDRILVLDTETTGFSPYADRVVEFAAVEVLPRTGAVGKRLRRLVNPGRSIPERVVHLHGITNERVRNEPAFGALADELTEFVGGATLAIHNSRFDVSMLNAELARAGRPRLEELGVRIVDTVAVARSVYPLMPGHSLDSLCRHLRISLAERAQHGALLDALLLAKALPQMASDYDAWMAGDDEAGSPELDRFEGALSAYCEALLGSIDSNTAQGSDAGLSRVATALRWVDAQREVLTERCEALIEAASWCDKRVLAYRKQREWTSWKAAAEGLLLNMDLSSYTIANTSQVVTPLVAVPEASFLATLEPIVNCVDVLSSPHCVARATIALSNARDTLATQRQTLRAGLLRYVDAGYFPQRASVKVSPRTTIDYRKAVAERACGADLEPYRLSNTSLTLRSRSAAACRLLFGTAA